MAGRPRKTWTAKEREKFEKLCGIFCTKEEVCAILELDPKTLDKLIADDYPDSPTWKEAFDKFSAVGRVSLRRKQYETAIGGDRTMQIFLGKNYLGQSDQGAKPVEQTKPQKKMAAFTSSAKFAKAING